MDIIIRILIFVVVWLVAYSILRYILAKKQAKVINPPLEETRLEQLRKYRVFEKKGEETIDPIVTLYEPALECIEKYGYSKVLEGVEKGSDEVAFCLLHFVCEHFHHIPDATLPAKHDITSIITNAEEHGNQTNCRGLSLILAQLLRMNGIKARHVTCLPYEEPCEDCHVVVDCILPSGMRIMLDPTYRLFLSDDKGEYVSIKQLREGILQGKEFTKNPEASYNGGAFDLDYYIGYMTKNLLRFRVNTVYTDNNSDNWGNEIELVPKDYPMKGFAKTKRFVFDEDAFWRM